MKNQLRRPVICHQMSCVISCLISCAQNTHKILHSLEHLHETIAKLFAALQTFEIWYLFFGCQRILRKNCGCCFTKNKKREKKICATRPGLRVSFSMISHLFITYISSHTHVQHIFDVDSLLCVFCSCHTHIHWATADVEK